MSRKALNFVSYMKFLCYKAWSATSLSSRIVWQLEQHDVFRKILMRIQRELFLPNRFFVLLYIFCQKLKR